MIPPSFPYLSWFLPGLGSEPLLVQTFDAPRDPTLKLLAPMFVVGYLERWLEEPGSRSILLDIHSTLFGGRHAASWSHGEEHRWLKPELRTAFERLDLIVLIEFQFSAPSPSPRLVPSSPPPAPTSLKLKTFIEIVLLDRAGKPVVGEAFKITLPDGAVVTGKLDANGFKRVDGVDPGTCDVEFPNLDGREWGPRPFDGPGRVRSASGVVR